jgi:hypothetical protein
MGVRLTIGIPTQGKRIERLAKAIGSALNQSTPSLVVVADQDDNPDVRDLLAPYAGHPLLRRLVTGAEGLWPNWTAAAEACTTEFFAWCQDDDLLAPHFASRIIRAFDAFPTAQTWLARLGISLVEGLANWGQSTGPMVPMDLLHGAPTLICNGDLLIAGGYFTSFALSPAVAIRYSLDAIQALRRCPMRGCDIYLERILLAELGRLGPAIADPAMVGYWVQHEDNESAKQNAVGGAAAQYPALVAHLDALLKGRPDASWIESLKGWALFLTPDNLRHYLRESADYEPLAPTLTQARAVLQSRLDVYTQLVAARTAELAARQTEPQAEPSPAKPTRSARKKAAPAPV